MSRNINEYESKLLQFNYEKIHESVWENHKISWTVTAIFLTAIFGFQTFIVKDYFSAEKRIWTQVFIAVFIIEGLVLIWFLIMYCFRSYNLIRFYRLRQIEEILSSNKISEDKDLMRQYNYEFRCFPRPHKEEIFGKCEEPISEKKGFDFFEIYKLVFIIISFLNLVLAYAAYIYRSQPI